MSLNLVDWMNFSVWLNSASSSSGNPTIKSVVIPGS